MEFNFDIEKAIGNISENGIVFLDGRNYKQYDSQTYINIRNLLDTIGELSAKAQKLKQVITTGSRFFGTDQRIYLKCKGNIFIGFIKVGKKHLFIYDEIGKITEMNPLCVLDFYVYEKCQRSGNGKIIYSEMIEKENIEPRKLGYDRPSIKFINFLKKYYKLVDYIPQNNNYVVFKDYFRENKKKVELPPNINNNIRLNNNTYGYYHTTKNLSNPKNYTTYSDSYLDFYKNTNNTNNININPYNKYPQKKERAIINNCPYDTFKKPIEENKNKTNFNPYEKYTPKKDDYKNDTYSKTMKAEQIQKEYFTEKEPKDEYRFLDSYKDTYKNPYNNPFLFTLNDYKVEKPKSYIDSLFPPIKKYQYQSSSSEYGSFY